MKKQFGFLIGAALSVLIFSTSAGAAGYYVGIHGGGSFLPEAKASDADGSINFSYDAGYDASVTLGYDLGDSHPEIGRGRVEVEFNTASNDPDEAEFVEGGVGAAGSVERVGVMFNTIGEYKTRTGIIYYALLGLGWAEITLDNLTILGEPFADDSDSRLAYQAGLGVAWKFAEHLYFDLGYRYFSTTDLEFIKEDGTSLDYEYAGHRILAGIRLHF